MTVRARSLSLPLRRRFFYHLLIRFFSSPAQSRDRYTSALIGIALVPANLWISRATQRSIRFGSSIFNTTRNIAVLPLRIPAALNNFFSLVGKASLTFFLCFILAHQRAFSKCLLIVRRRCRLIRFGKVQVLSAEWALNVLIVRYPDSSFSGELGIKGCR